MRVDAVRDRRDAIARIHVLRRFGVALGHAVDVLAQVERELRGVEVGAPGKQPQSLAVDEVVEQALHEVVREPVVPGLDGRVRREVTLLSRARYVVTRLAGPDRVCIVGILVEELEREQRRVALVQVIRANIEVERLEHPHAADAEHDLLAQPICLVAAVEKVRDRAIVKPAADPHRAPVDGHGHLRRQRLGPMLGLPRIRLRNLPAVGVDALAEIAFPAHERDADERDSEIRGRAHRIAGQHSQAAAVRRDFAAQRNLHREVRHARMVQELLELVGIQRVACPASKVPSLDD